MFHSRFLVASILCIYFVGVLLHTVASNGGFTVDLIRRDSPNSPFLNPNNLQSLRESLNEVSPRSEEKKNPNAAIAKAMGYRGEHIIKISLGTPPVDIYGILDTGSDLVWTQCVPCVGCYPQINPLFDPKKSSTYLNVSCHSQQCQLLDGGSCNPQNICHYGYGYEDRSVTEGVLATERVTLTSTSGVTFSTDIAIGCGHNDTGVFNDHEMGMIGLGGGPLSFASQIGSAFGSRRFSHCLVPFGTDPNNTSKVSFGDGSEVKGPGVVSTPLPSMEFKTPYYVTLEGISVGNKYVPFSSSGKVSKGNIFLDSGTPPTMLPQNFYNRLAAEVKKQIPMSPIVGDPDLGTQLCYKSKTRVRGPILTVHFEGADVQLTPIQTFIPPKDGVFCFAMAGMEDDVGIYGNFAQSNFLIGFDMETRMVSFKPADCTKHV